jgi:hypothetical protein
MPRHPFRDLAATPEELEAAKTAASAGQNDATIGGGIGTALGALAGGLIGGIPTAGAGALPGAATGAGIGGSLGTAIGGLVGAGQADTAQKTLSEDELKRQKALEDEQLYQEAVNRLMQTG